MKRLLLLLPILLLLIAACGDTNEDAWELEKKEHINEMHNDYGSMGLDGLSVMWEIEEAITDTKEARDGVLFSFTDDYLLDKDAYEKSSDKEQDVVMRVSGMVSKFKSGAYDDRSKFNQDKEELLRLLKY